MSKRARREKRDKVRAHLEKEAQGSKRPAGWVFWSYDKGGFVFRPDIKKKLFWTGVLIMWVGLGIFLVTQVLS